MHPKKAVIDNLYQIKYEIKNLSKVAFPGSTIWMEMYLSALGDFLVNNHQMPIGELEPGETIRARTQRFEFGIKFYPHTHTQPKPRVVSRQPASLLHIDLRRRGAPPHGARRLG